ncbi:transglutaminase family protein [Methylovorus sp. MM2]|uniref:transglutaminase family protein n=1 Tax=Methylovorus sp. MM2 TaxID=1848038 RepID=UPI0013F4C5C2|nr:transglutaminase family protein [Methylovorus sp. MM2]
MTLIKLICKAFLLICLCSCGLAFADNAPLDLKPLRSILQLPDNKIDLARAKLVIDKTIDPSIDIRVNLKTIDSMVSTIRSMLPANATDEDKLNALRTYIYYAGSWNSNRAYNYDFDDPLGTRLGTKLLINYIASRKGNCVSMPLLFIILGQRLGLDVTAANAPQHILVKYRDPSGNLINIEATSGAKPARDIWYRQNNPMTDQAIANGVYLRALSKKETVATMTFTLAEHYMDTQEYEKVIDVTDLVLEYAPKSVDAMVLKGTASGRLVKERYVSKYPTPNLIPLEQRAAFESLAHNNQYWFQQAETLGWREPSQADDESYLQRVGKHQ